LDIRRPREGTTCTVGKKSSGARAAEFERRARTEELKRAQAAQERRRNLKLAVIGVVIVAGLVAIPVVQAVHRHQEKNRDPATLGVSTAAAMCDAALTDAATGSQDHVNAGVHVDYATVPPSSGRHFAIPVTVNARGFYTTKDSPPVEQLVHNLEHGYTIAWYDPKIDSAQLGTLRELAGLLRGKQQYTKFIAAPWDTSRGVFPAGRPIALSHWGGQNRGYRQFCGLTSGAAIVTFMNDHPATDAPDPNTP
jgi:hypothetical protein